MGELMAFSSLAWTLSNPMRLLGTILNDLQRFFVSADKVIELYYTQPMIQNRDNARQVEGRLKGGVEFENVSLAFGNQYRFIGHQSFGKTGRNHRYYGKYRFRQDHVAQPDSPPL